MKPIVLDRLIDDFHERPLPDLMPRHRELQRVSGYASVITGMRRAGKTWLCYQDMQTLLAGGIDKERLLYLNFEDERLLPFETRDFEQILETYYRKFPHFKDQLCYLYLDEVQRIQGWELFVRRILDTERIAVCVTGSSSRLLSTEIATSLRGRALTTEVFPFSFREFLRFHHPEAADSQRFGSRTRAILQQTLAQYRRIGGFPEVQTLSDELRRQILRTYLDVVILRDVVERFGITNTVALRALMRNVLSAPATRFSVNRFYNTLRSREISCTKNDLYAFLKHLNEAYLVYLAPVHARSEKKRQVNPRKVYAVDSGLLEAMSFHLTGDHGAALENMVYMHLRRSGLEPEYYSTSEGFEVDFVVTRDDSPTRALIQVCWSLADEATRAREIRALRVAMKELNDTRGTIVTWLDEASPEANIEVVPAWRWLLKDPLV